MVRLITPFILCLFGIVVSVYSYITYADFTSYGAAFYPTVIGAFVSIFSLIDLGMEIKMKSKYVFQSFNLSQDCKIILLIIGVIFFYIFCVEYLGFIITVSIILITLTLPLLKTGKILTALFLIILSVGIYYLFARVLLVNLPSGIWFE
jgi:hypothetical protein